MWLGVDHSSCRRASLDPTDDNADCRFHTGREWRRRRQLAAPPTNNNLSLSLFSGSQWNCITLSKVQRKLENHLLLVEGITKSLEPAASPLGRSESCFRLFLFYVRVCSLFGGFGFVLCLCVSFFGGFVERQLCSKSLGRSDSCGSL